MNSKHSHLKDFSKHTSELREKAMELGGDVQEIGNITKEIVRDGMGRLKDGASTYYQQGLKKAEKWEGNVEEKIRQKPLQSLLVAAGAGFLLGVIWKKR